MNVDRGGSAVGSTADSEWIKAEGYYVDGKIKAVVPKIDNFDPEVLSYSVDIALNG